MKNNKSLVSCMAIAVALGGMAMPASADTLKEALVKAYQNNPSLLSQRESLKATDELVARARSGYRPTLTMDLNKSRTQTNDSFPVFGPAGIVQVDSFDSQSFSLSLRQNLFQGFRVMNGDRRARADVEAARAQLTSVEQTVMLNAATAYLDVLRDLAVEDLNLNQIKVLERQLQASQDRFRVGEITRTDVAQSEARLEGAKSALRTAEAALSASKARYRRVVGDLPQGLSTPSKLPELPGNLEDALEIAGEYAPNVLIAKQNQKSAEYGVKQARGSLYPTVSATASISGQDRNLGDVAQPYQESKTIGLRVSVPLYAGGATYSDIRRAKRLRSQSMMDIRQAERIAAENAFVAWDNLRAATARIASNEAQVRANRIALEGVRQESSVGSRTTLEVLNQEQELLNAQVQLIRAQRDELVASYNLLASVGKLTAKSLGLNVNLYDPDKNLKKVKNKFIGG